MARSTEATSQRLYFNPRALRDELRKQRQRARETREAALAQNVSAVTSREAWKRYQDRILDKDSPDPPE